MSKASGVVLILAGLAVAAYALPSSKDTSESEFPQFTEVAKSPPAGNPSQVTAAPESQPAPPPPPRAVAKSASVPAPIVVTIAQRPSEPQLAQLPRPSTTPRDRDTIGRELQKELKRVGCYEGELTGAWTTSTRQAMKAFTDRVNATLPIDEPDSILLTLVQAYQDKVCGKPCPAGQGLSDAGRCVPNAILARTNKKGVPIAASTPVDKPLPAITGWSTTTTAANAALTGVPPTDGRMALAGPTTPEATPPDTPPPAAAPPAAKEKRAPRVGSSGGSWAHNLLMRRDSLN